MKFLCYYSFGGVTGCFFFASTTVARLRLVSRSFICSEPVARA